jgi:perosamine synthetase
MQGLLDRGISTRRGVMCAHREAAYSIEPWRCASGDHGACGCPGGVCTRLTQSEKATDEGLILPLYAQMTEAEQDEVIDSLCAALAAAGD